MLDETKEAAAKSDSKNVVSILSSPNVQKGLYSNVALIHHTEEEFMLDFLLQLGGEAQLISRIILSPAHFRRLKNAIDENLDHYEQKFGQKRDKKA